VGGSGGGGPEREPVGWGVPVTVYEHEARLWPFALALVVAGIVAVVVMWLVSR